jgi:ribonuclease VapC
MPPLCWLCIAGSPAGRRSRAHSRTRACRSVVNMAEVASHYSKLGMPDDVVAAMLTPLPITLVDSDAEQCWRPADCAA